MFLRSGVIGSCMEVVEDVLLAYELLSTTVVLYVVCM